MFMQSPANEFYHFNHNFLDTNRILQHVFDYILHITNICEEDHTGGKRALVKYSAYKGLNYKTNLKREVLCKALKYLRTFHGK